MRKNQGITLIALIITIIVMLILVGVVVTIVIQSDLLGTAKTAGDKHKIAYEEESKMSGVTINEKQYGSIEEYMEEINPTIVEGDPKDWDYTVESDGTITITRYLNEDRTIDTVVIPNYIGGVPVKRVKGNAGGTGGTTIWNEKICDGRDLIAGSATVSPNDTIKKIIVLNGIEVIESGAFAHTKNLEKITLPSTLLELGNYSFLGCASLTNIMIPNSVAKIGKLTFRFCNNLTEITIPSSVTTMGTHVFTDIPSITVHVSWKEGEKPEGWDDNWTDSNVVIDYAK